jgi:hypothetical protein
MEAWPGTLKERNQPLLIVFGRCCDSDCIEVDSMLLMESGAFAADLSQFLPGVGDDLQEVHIAG